jgi:hypothetical protein
MDHERSTTRTALIALVAPLVLAACGEEPPPTSVSQFMENPILLEATMVRCVENRAEARYDPECLNARDAVNRIAAREEQARRAELEAQSERKRQAVRRAQEAAAEARRRTLEEQRRQEEAELLGPFAPQPGDERGPVTPREEPPAEPSEETRPTDSPQQPSQEAPGPVEDDASTDLESIRRELERRQNDPENDL